MEINDIYRELKWRLKEAQVPSYAIAARQLVQKFLGVPPQELLKGDCDSVTPAAAQQLWDAAAQLMEHRPLQYILGEWDFYGRTFTVGEGVLIPRADTEILCDATLPFLKKRPTPRIVCDLCSGSGCVAVTLAEEGNAKVYAVEKAGAAFAFLKQNAATLSKNVTPLQCDALADSTLKKIPLCDVITINPPYLTREDMQNLQPEVGHEPPEALYGGDDGLDYYRVLPKLWKSKLVRGGMLAVEIGIGQETAVLSLLEEQGFTNLRTHADLNRIPRVITGINE